MQDPQLKALEGRILEEKMRLNAAEEHLKTLEVPFEDHGGRQTTYCTPFLPKKSMDGSGKLYTRNAKKMDHIIMGQPKHQNIQKK